MSRGQERREGTLGFISLLALGLNGIVGVGIFFAPAKVAGFVPGKAGVSLYLLTALALFPVAICYAVLGGRFREDGGPYVWAREAFGSRAAFHVGWITYASALFSTSAVVSGLGKHAAPSLGLSAASGQLGLSLGVICLLTLVAASGLRPSAVAWTAVTVLKLIPLLVLVGVGLSQVHQLPPAQPQEVGLGDLSRALLVVVFATQGFEIVPVPAGNARKTGRAVPLATLGSLLLAALLYTGLHWVCVTALPELASSSAPLVDAAAHWGGSSLSALLAVGTNVSALGIAFGMFAMTPRYLAALGVPDALGHWLGKAGSSHVPRRALWVTALVVVLLVALGDLSELLVLSSVAVLTQYLASVVALMVLAWKGERGLGLRHMVPALLAIGSALLIALGAELRELLVASAVLLAGGAIRWLHRLWVGPR